jgi:hypothetical protein
MDSVAYPPFARHHVVASGGGTAMGDELASANVNRSYSLAATSIAIFTFTLFFLYPRFKNGEVNALLFPATLARFSCPR